MTRHDDVELGVVTITSAQTRNEAELAVTTTGLRVNGQLLIGHT